MFSRMLKFRHLPKILLNNQHLIIYAQRLQCTSVKPERWSAERYSIYIIAPKLHESKIVTKDEWRQIRAEFMQKVWRINEKNVDGQILRVCKDNVNALENAKTYLNLLIESKVELNLGMSNTLLEIYVNRSHENSLSAEDIQNVENICQAIRTKYPTYLDSKTTDCLVSGLTLTNEWRLAVEILDQQSEGFDSLSKSYCLLVRRAFMENDVDLGFRLLVKFVNNCNLNVDCEVFLAYWDYCSRQTNDARKHVEKMLELIQNERLIVAKKTIDGLYALLKEIGTSLTYTAVLNNGKCLHCNHSLCKIEVSTAEYKALKHAFYDNVLIRSNVYMQSTPEEVQRFREFIVQRGHFNWVIDGLNAAFKIKQGKVSAKLQATSVANVVKHFHNRNERVLLMGRHHMQRWPTWQYIKSHCKFFLVDDISKDDTFILYAALCGGPETKIISADMMRNHAHLLGPELKPVFQRWQQKHQYDIKAMFGDGTIKLQPSIQFNIYGHKHNGIWHIPYIGSYEPRVTDLYAYNMPESWACFQL